MEQERRLHQLAELVRKLTKGEKLTGTQRQALVERCLHASRTFDLAKLKSALELESAKLEDAVSEHLRSKREVVLQEAERAGFQVRRLTEYDRIGPVRVRHKGPATTILFGKLPIENFEESTGALTAERILATLKNILNAPFDPTAFYKGFTAAYKHARLESTSREGWVRFDEIHREYTLELIRRGMMKNRQSGVGKVENYDMVNFLVEFARFLQAPKYPSGEYIRSRTPPMAQMKDAFLVPDLTVPLGEEKPYLDLKVEHET